MKSLNMLTPSAQEFTQTSDFPYGGWEVSVGSASVRRFINRGPYPKYVPVGTSLGSGTQGNIIRLSPTGGSAITVSSPYIPIRPNKQITTSIVLGSLLLNRKATLRVEFYEAEQSETIITRNNDTNPVSVYTDFIGSNIARLSTVSLPPRLADYAKIFVDFTDDPDTDSLSSEDLLILYDPAMIETSASSSSTFGYSVYEALPSFMRLDDQNLNEIVSGNSTNLPLLKYTDALSTRLAFINNSVYAFRYDRASVGTEHLSALTDPLTCDSSYLNWLAAITGSDIFALNSGSTIWLVLAALDKDEDNIPSEWGDDIEALISWSGLESENPEFFDTENMFRKQISTGFVGINAGTEETIIKYLKTLLSGDGSAPDDSIRIFNRSKDSAFRVLLYVNADVDPDPGGNFMAEIAQIGMPAGTTVEKTNSLERASDFYYDVDEFVTAVTGNSSFAGGVKTIRSVVDSSHHGSHMVTTYPGTQGSFSTYGGEAGNSLFTAGNAVYSNPQYSWESESHPALSLDVKDGYEVIVELGGIQEVNASPVEEITEITNPPQWLYREKRIIAYGTDLNEGTDGNDWALYMVSGSGLSEDPEVRLMWVDGYNSVANEDNYAVSDPIQLDGLSSTSPLAIRVAVDTVAKTVTFYAQRTLFGNWNSNMYGIKPIEPRMGASTEPGINILSSKNDGPAWGRAPAIAASCYRVMLWQQLIVFPQSEVSSTVHAYVRGEGSADYSNYDYRPNAFINFYEMDKYATSYEFLAATGDTSPDGNGGVVTPLIGNG